MFHEVRPHPLNRDFTWVPSRRDRRLVTDDQARQWDDDGYFLLEGAIDVDRLSAVTGEIDPFEARTTEYLRSKGGTVLISSADDITFTTHLVTQSDLLRAFAAGEPFTDLCADLVGSDVRLYWDQAVYKKPEPVREFPWHQDNGYTYIEPQQYLTCWVPLVDATVDNGCPWVLPGLHRRGTLEHWITPLGFQCVDADDPLAASAMPVEAKAGDVVVFSSLTPHRTGPNTTDGVRKAYILQYAPDGAEVGGEGHARAGRQDDPDRQFLVVQGGEPIR